MLNETNLKKHRKVQKALGLIETNPHYPSLNSHKYQSISGPEEEEIWESYVENNTPAAWRIFWYYGPYKSIITIFAIAPHP